ncbi:TauD/TfdA family dioxygenase [Streptomyces gilvosporeus]|uniref:L-asparagine oxygenase n=1 Tax=Streptomyces gilvosporeus TaxID=553510 RepID=A0A1V0TN24_9ACTN|nr:TauD/TfdA family dioxygenase [Streptomyces gilvosporeus]ARF54337.1 L-asparagine oxygenase [Streptomyces gilvosporeus]
MSPVALETHAAASRVALDRLASDTVAGLAERLVRHPAGAVDDPAWAAATREACHALPEELRAALARFRRHSGPQGALLLRGLPVGDEAALPPTPTVPDSVQRDPSVSAAVLLMIACALGDPAAFRAEKLGALVQNVVPVKGSEEVQGNTGSVLLTFHNENAFHRHRPDFVMLLCLRTDHEGVAGLRTACIRQALGLLDPSVRERLASPEFVTNPPPSFGPQQESVVHPVLSGDPADPDVRVDFAATTATTPRAAQAMDALQEAFEAVQQTVRLRPGELAIVDNRVTVHGRTSFRPRYDGSDRWLQRTFVLCDLRRSREHRPEDGHVLIR